MTLHEIEVDERDAQGRAVRAHVEVSPALRFARGLPGFVFSGPWKAICDGDLCTLDPCPNDWYGSFCGSVIKQLCEAEELGESGLNVLYERIAQPDERGLVSWPAAAAASQSRFLVGLQAMHRAGALHDFEPSKQAYIGSHGNDPILLVQGPPGTGKSYATAFALFARLQGALAAGRPYRALVSCKTHAATDELLRNLVKVRSLLGELQAAQPALFAEYFDVHLLEVPLFRHAPRSAAPEGVAIVAKYDKMAFAELGCTDHFFLASTPGGVYRAIKDAFGKHMLGHHLVDCLVLDEASQMNLPEAILAALPLRPGGQVLVVGDHRQMPPIVKHDWETEPRRSFRQFCVYSSLYEAVRSHAPPTIRFAESFRLHAVRAEFLRQEIYRHDGIEFYSRRHEVLPARPLADDFVAAVLRPEYPLVVVVHDEDQSQTRNEFEQALITPVIAALTDPALYGLDAEHGLGA